MSINRTITPLNLKDNDYFLKFTTSDNPYLGISGLDTIVGTGKYSFFINGSEYLTKDTEIRFEAIDSSGNLLFISGVKNILRGTSRVVSFEIDRNKSNGIAQIFVSAVLDRFIDSTGEESSIPANFEERENILLTHTFQIDKSINNVDEIIFEKPPKLTVTPTLKKVRTILKESSASSSITTVIDKFFYDTEQGIMVVDVTAQNPSDLLLDMDGGSITLSGDYVIPIEEAKINLSGRKGKARLRIPNPNISDIDEQAFTNILNLNPSQFFTFTVDYTESAKYNLEKLQEAAFADIKVLNMGTVSGDVEKIKIFAKSDTLQTNFNLLSEYDVVSQNLLEIEDIGNVGIFDDDTKLLSWNTSKFGSVEDPIPQRDESVFYGGVTVTGKYDEPEFINVKGKQLQTPRYTFQSDVNLDFFKNVEYKIRINAAVTDIGGNDTRCDIYINGIGLTGDTNQFGKLIGSFRSSKNYVWEEEFEATFKNDEDVTFGEIVFVITSGKWIFQNISISSELEKGFSPDEFRVRVPVDIKKDKQDMDFVVQFYDANNNRASGTLNEFNVIFDRPNLVIEGFENFLSGSLFVGDLTSSGVGLGLSDNGGAFVKSIPYQGFIDATTGGTPGFMLYSGSILSAVPDEYTSSSLGVEVVKDENNYLRFRSDYTSSVFEVLSDTFFFGNEDTQFISGSDSNIEISSSIFHLDPKNNLLILRGAIRQDSSGSIIQDLRQRGNWEPDEFYLVNDIVQYVSSSVSQSYIAVNEHSSSLQEDENPPEKFGPPEPDNFNNWSVFAGAAEAGSGSAGPGIVYRGEYVPSSSFTYIASSTRRDVVEGTDGNYYLCALTHTGDDARQPVTGVSFSAFWDNFGAQFDSVATDILLARDATIRRGLVMGEAVEETSGSFIRSVDMINLETGSGFFLSSSGQFIFGDDDSSLSFTDGVLTLKGALRQDSGGNLLTEIINRGTWQPNVYYEENNLVQFFSGSFQTSSFIANTGHSSSLTGVNGPPIIVFNDEFIYDTGSNWDIFALGGVAEDGIDGIDARTVELIADDQSVIYDQAGLNPNPSSIELTATGRNITSGSTPFFEFVVNDITQQNTDSNTFTLTPTASVDNMPQVVVVKLRENSNSSSVLAEDQTTIFGVQNGSDAYTIILSNEAHVLPTTSEGTVFYGGSGTEIEVYRGDTQLQGILSGTPTIEEFSVSAIGTNINPDSSPTLDEKNIVFGDADTITETSASILFGINVENITTFTKKQSFSKATDGLDGASAEDGSDGTNARAVNLIATDQSIEYDTNGENPSPSSVEITANAVNTEETVYYHFFLNDDDTQQNTTSNTFTLTPESSIDNMPQKVEVQIRETSPINPILARDQLTIFGIKNGTDGEDGADAYTVILTNEAHTLPTTNTGIVTETGSGTSVIVYKGATELNGITSGTPEEGQFSVTVSETNITAGSQTSPGNPIVFGDASNMTADNASIEFTINAENVATITKIQSFAKSKEGDDGQPGVGSPGPGVVFRGVYGSNETYFHTDTRRDVVLYNGNYYLTNNISRNGTSSWGIPTGGDWESFGATFSSVATDILFAQDVYANRTINIGSDGSTPLIALNSDFSNDGANPFISIGQGDSPGFNNNGIFLGYDGGTEKLSLVGTDSLTWNGDTLDLTGTLSFGNGDVIERNGDFSLGGGNFVFTGGQLIVSGAVSTGSVDTLPLIIKGGDDDQEGDAFIEFQGDSDTARRAFFGVNNGHPHIGSSDNTNSHLQVATGEIRGGPFETILAEGGGARIIRGGISGGDSNTRIYRRGSEKIELTTTGINVTGNITGSSIQLSGLGTSANTEVLVVDGSGNVTKNTSFSGGGTGDITSVIAGNALTGGGTDGDVTLNVDESAINGSNIINDLGWTSNTGDITSVSAGGGLTGGDTSGAVTISHADTSSQGSSNNSGNTVIQDITLDTYGHVTGIGTTTLTFTDTNNFVDGVSFNTGNGILTLSRSGLGDLTVDLDGRYSTSTPNNATIQIIAGTGLDGGGDFTTNQITNENIPLSVKSSEIKTSELNNDAGFTSNSGTVTQVNVGTGLDVVNATTSPTITLDLSELSAAGTLTLSDEFIVLDGGAERKVLPSNIPLSIFNNDAGFTSNTGDITSVSTGGGLSGGGTNGAVTLSHADTSTLSGTYGGNDNGIVIEDITVDTYGHVTNVGTRDLDSRFDSRYVSATSNNDFIRMNVNNGLYYPDPINEPNFRYSGTNGYWILSGADLRMQVNFDVYASDFNLYSDKRLKSNIIPLSDNIDKVKNLTPYSYEKGGKEEIGIIAQDLEKLHPELVKEDSDGYKQISTMVLQTINLGAIKELIEKVEYLENKVKELENKNGN